MNDEPKPRARTAERAGTLPPQAPAPRRAVEDWQRAKQPGTTPEQDWRHATAAALHAWVVGEELTEAEYDAALAAAANVKLGY